MGVTMARPPPPHLLSCPLSSVESEGGSDGGGDLQGELHLATSGGAPPLLASGHSSSTAISASAASSSAAAAAPILHRQRLQLPSADNWRELGERLNQELIRRGEEAKSSGQLGSVKGWPKVYTCCFTYF